MYKIGNISDYEVFKTSNCHTYEFETGLVNLPVIIKGNGEILAAFRSIKELENFLDAEFIPND